MNTQPKPRYPWKPMQRTYNIKPPSDELLDTTARLLGVSREEAKARVLNENENTETWINDIYQVLVRNLERNAFHLNIRRRDGGPILRDWRHFQWIKNEIIGPECEAVELYPAESRLADTTNKFHLWGSRDPNFRFPFGFIDRLVDYTGGSKNTPGLRQRPL